MLRSTQRLLQQAQTANAAQLQQLRFLNVHEYQVSDGRCFSLPNHYVSSRQRGCGGWGTAAAKGLPSIPLPPGCGMGCVLALLAHTQRNPCNVQTLGVETSSR